MNTLKITFSPTKYREKLNVWMQNNGFITRIGYLHTGHEFNKTLEVNPHIYPLLTDSNINLPPQLIEANKYRWIDVPNGNRRLITTRTYYLHFARQTEIDGVDYLSLPIWQFGREKALQFEAGEMLNYSQILQGVI
jgi:hypothetical protein